jgi:CRP/FNR family transcriptional regulator
MRPMDWTAPLASPEFAARLAALPARRLPAGTVLFRPGEPAQGFVVVLEGRIEVRLTAETGREVLLYAVEPGQTCVQTTLGLLGDEAYTGEAICATEVLAVLIPRGLFSEAMDRDARFRRFVLTAFGRRMADVTRVMERVAFGRIEPRLAAALLDLASDGAVQATQAELAARIGSAREVVGRHLAALSREGLIAVERGRIVLIDLPALRKLAAGPV